MRFVHPAKARAASDGGQAKGRLIVAREAFSGAMNDIGLTEGLMGEVGDSKLRVVLVGAFRSIVPEGGEGEFGGQGGFVDTLAPAPYSLANGYLKAYAEADPELRRRCEIELVVLSEPLFLEDEREEVRLTEEQLQLILSREPDIVAFSTYCWNIDAVSAAAGEIARRRAKAPLVLLGGRGTDGDPEGLLAETPGADAVIIGEGEEAFREILHRFGRDLSDIPGVIWRDAAGAVHSGGPPQCVLRLDDIPSPYLAGILEPARHGVMLELSRGCLHGCGYCTWNADKRLRFFGPGRIEAEVAWLKQRGHRHVTVTDSAVNYDTDRLREAVAAINRADPEGEVLFTYNVRHDSLDEEQLEILTRLPTHMVLLGVETFTPGAMAVAERAVVDLDALRTRLEGLSRATRPPVVSIVLGLPGDDEAGFRHTLDTLMAWVGRAVGTVLVSLLQVYRGSGLWARREELGLRFQERGIPYLLESPTWPAPSLARCKSYLLQLMAGNRETLKAAEAIVLMEGRGDVDPWLTRRRVLALLGEEWPLGAVREGWILERVGLLRDTGQAASLRFQWAETGGTVRLGLTRRAGGERGPMETRIYSLSQRLLPGPDVPAPAGQQLLLTVRDIIIAGEERVARAAQAARER